jgi:hypothetical protein
VPSSVDNDQYKEITKNLTCLYCKFATYHIMVSYCSEYLCVLFTKLSGRNETISKRSCCLCSEIFPFDISDTTPFGQLWVVESDELWTLALSVATLPARAIVLKFHLAVSIKPKRLRSESVQFDKVNTTKPATQGTTQVRWTIPIGNLSNIITELRTMHTMLGICSASKFQCFTIMNAHTFITKFHIPLKTNKPYKSHRKFVISRKIQ